MSVLRFQLVHIWKKKKSYQCLMMKSWMSGARQYMKLLKGSVWSFMGERKTILMRQPRKCNFHSCKSFPSARQFHSDVCHYKQLYVSKWEMFIVTCKVYQYTCIPLCWKVIPLSQWLDCLCIMQEKMVQVPRLEDTVVLHVKKWNELF